MACLPAITSSLQLDRNIDVVTASGTLTVNGGQMPTSPTSLRGSLSFLNKASGDVMTTSIGPSGAATFSMLLFAGTYDVTFTSAESSALVGLPTGQSTLLATDVVIASSQSFTWNLSVVTLTGAFTVNRGQMPTSPAERGVALFSSSGSGSTARVSVGSSGPATYSTLLFAGAYDVSFASGRSTSLVGLPVDLKTVVATNVPILTSRSLDWDLPVVTASGTLTVNGGQMPSSTVERGYVQFTHVASGDYLAKSIGSSGAATFSLSLFGGTYDVTFASARSTSLVGLPVDLRTSVAKGVVLSSSQAFAWNLPVVTVSGTLTVNGGQMPGSASVSSRGFVQFTDKETSDYIADSMGPTGAATFSLLLFGGTYDVAFTSASSTALVGLPIDMRTVVANNLTLTTSRAFTWDLPVVTVSGTLTVNSGQMPSSPSDRGELRFTDAASLDSQLITIDASGAAIFSTTLFGGRYDVLFTSADSTDLVGLPIDASTLLARGLTINSSQSFTWNMPVVTVSGTLTLNGGQFPSSSINRGQIQFSDIRSMSTTWVDVGSTGVARFSALLFGGNYDVNFTSAESSALVGLPSGSVTRIASACP